jgi:hypothetical protein
MTRARLREGQPRRPEHMLRKCDNLPKNRRLDVLRDDEGDDPIGESFGRNSYGNTS